MAFITEDPVKSIDLNSREITFESGGKSPLSDEEYFALTATPSMRSIQEQTKEDVRGQEKLRTGTFSMPEAVNTFIDSWDRESMFTKGARNIKDLGGAAFEGLRTREGQENLGYFGRAAEYYQASRQGRREALDEQFARSPKAAMGGTIAGLATDVVAGVPGVKSPTAMGAIYGAMAPEKSVLEDPGAVLKEGAIGAGLGFGLGVAGEKIGRMASERKALQTFAKTEKAAERNYKAALEDWQVAKGEAEEAYKLAKRDAGRVDAQSQQRYQENLLKFQQAESEAQQAYQEASAHHQNVMGQKLEAMNKDLGGYGINKDAIAVDEFISGNVRVSGQAGSKEAKQISGFLAEVTENLPQKMEGKDVARLFEAVEERLSAASTPFEEKILSNFKNHLLERLPEGAAQNRLMQQVAPRIERKIVQIVDSTLDKMPRNAIREVEKTLLGEGGYTVWRNDIKEAIRQNIRNMNPDELAKLISNRDATPLISSLVSNPEYQQMIRLSEGLAEKLSGPLGTVSPKSINAPGLFEAETRFQALPSTIAESINPALRNASVDAQIAYTQAKDKVTSRISNAVGLENPRTGRKPTNLPPRQPQSGVAPSEPVQVAESLSSPVIPAQPVAPTPGLPPEVGYLAERFESTPMNIGQSGGRAGLLYGAGKMLGFPQAGAIVGAGIGGKAAIEGTLRGITSPGAIASAGRDIAGKYGIQTVVKQISTDYPSYENGVIQDPIERREAVAEIERDSVIPLQNKAIMQAYINRGKSLEKLIRGR